MLNKSRKVKISYFFVKKRNTRKVDSQINNYIRFYKVWLLSFWKRKKITKKIVTYQIKKRFSIWEKSMCCKAIRNI